MCIEGVCEQVAEENIWPKREEVVGGWRRQHNEELHKFMLYQLLLC